MGKLSEESFSSRRQLQYIENFVMRKIECRSLNHRAVQDKKKRLEFCGSSEYLRKRLLIVVSLGVLPALLQFSYSGNVRRSGKRIQFLVFNQTHLWRRPRRPGGDQGRYFVIIF